MLSVVVRLLGLGGLLLLAACGGSSPPPKGLPDLGATVDAGQPTPSDGSPRSDAPSLAGDAHFGMGSDGMPAAGDVPSARVPDAAPHPDAFLRLDAGTAPSPEETDFQTRAQALIQQVADFYRPPNLRPAYADTDPFGGGVTDAPKYYWPRVIARLYRDPTDEEAAYFIAQFASLSDKHAPFHFAFPGMTRVLLGNPNLPAVRQNRDAHLLSVWNRTDFYNAFTGEGTENQVLMSRTNAYLLLEEMQAAPPAGVSAATLRTRLGEQRDFLTGWSKRAFAMGFGEWESNTYLVFSAQGWLNLFDFARDPAIRAVARAVLDAYAVALAVKYTQGVLGGGSMRGTELESTSVDSGYLAWLWFGDSPRPVDVGANSQFFRGNAYMPSVHAATSGYRPPALAVALARKSLTLPATYHATKPTMLLEKSALLETVQLGTGYSLGSVLSPYGGFTGGDVQTVTWRLVARSPAQPTAWVVTGNGGERGDTNGVGRGPWDQVAQYQNVLIQMTRIPKDAGAVDAAITAIMADWGARWQADVSSRFPGGGPGDNLVTKAAIDVSSPSSYISYPEGAVQAEQGGVTFLNLEGVYLALTPLRGDQVVEKPAGTGRKLRRDQGPAESLCGWVVEVGTAAEQGSFAAFQTAIVNRKGLDRSGLASNRVVYTALSGRRIEAGYQSAGTFTEPIYNWGYGVTQPAVWMKSPPFMQPAWPSGEGHGRIATLTVDGKAVDLGVGGPLLDGPNAHFQDGHLTLQADHRRYDVDYSGTAPLFSEVP